VVDGQIGAEARRVAAATDGVADDHDANRPVAERAVPEGGAAGGQRGDLTTTESDRQRIPATASRRHRLGSGQAVATLARPATLIGPCPEGRVRAQAAEDLDVRGSTFQEGSWCIVASAIPLPVLRASVSSITTSSGCLAGIQASANQMTTCPTASRLHLARVKNR
jgi:hypothetical protein